MKIVRLFEPCVFERTKWLSEVEAVGRQFGNDVVLHALRLCENQTALSASAGKKSI
jgi:hypothetical protein